MILSHLLKFVLHSNSWEFIIDIRVPPPSLSESPKVRICSVGFLLWDIWAPRGNLVWGPYKNPPLESTVHSR